MVPLLPVLDSPIRFAIVPISLPLLRTNKKKCKHWISHTHCDSSGLTFVPTGPPVPFVVRLDPPHRGGIGGGRRGGPRAQYITHPTVKVYFTLKSSHHTIQFFLQN
jgi:hypothetical protein